MVNASTERGFVVSPEPPRGRPRRTIISQTTRDAAGRKRRIPEPLEPAFPLLSLRGILRWSPRAPSILDHGDVLNVSAGRYAIAHALRLLNIGPGDEVLVPAYHCSVMVDPIVALGAAPVFYKIGPDLAVDLEDSEEKITPATKAILAAHLFGFPQDGPALRAFADRHAIALIEDCAHAFFGEGMGSFGDFVIGSYFKFFPVTEGGCLVSKRPEIRHVGLQSQGVMKNFRQLIALIRISYRFRRLRVMGPLLRLIDGPSDASIEAPEEKPPTDPTSTPKVENVDYIRRDEDLDATGLTKLMVRHNTTRYTTERRRQNYQRVVDIVGETPAARPLFPRLESGIVPFMVPFWVDRLEALFPFMEDAAIPMQRYSQFLRKDIDESVCATTVDLSRHLVQLSCHQDLTEAEIRRFAGAFREIVLREN